MSTPHRSGWLRWGAAVAALTATFVWRRRRSAAMPLYGESLATRDRLLRQTDPVERARTVRLAPTGEYSVDMLSDAAEELERHRRSVSDELVTNLRTLASIYRRRNDLPRAESALRQLAAVLRPSPASDPAVIAVLADLADVIQRQDRPAEAERLWRRVAELEEAREGREPTVLAEAYWRAAECAAMRAAGAGEPRATLRLAK